MAEEIAFGIAAKLLSSLGSSAIQRIGLAFGVKEELEKINGTVSSIKNVLLDAQEKQVSSKTVKDWLQKLKEILYDADDLLDEVAIEAQRRELETHKRLVRKVRYFFTTSNSLVFRRTVGSKIKDIGERLDQIVSQIPRFEPIESIRREETSPLVNTRRIIGRKYDIEAFVRLLLLDQENVLTIPIVGIGGIGKTTLAQLVYNDDRVKKEFPKRLWVCVSTDFNFEQLLIKILKAGREWDNSCSNKGFHKLQNQVTSMLSANKFVLFLDDVWIENIVDNVEWNRLKDLLIRGASGSRIVVTTRSMMVASLVKTSIVEPFRLGSLSEVECLALLVKLAFKEGEENMHENLVNIGREIVKKCEGIPLAVVTLGSLLFSKRDVQDWLFVRDNEMWGRTQGEIGILSVLRLSYDQMPSHLKQCFAYCSLFERDELIDGKKLLHAWIAQGFVQCLDGKGELEHIGESYILELVNRFFLEPCDGRQTTIRKHYKMHGLVHSLAEAVAGDECMTIKGAVTSAIPRTLRHVAFDSKTYSEFPRPLMKAKKLRTLFYPRKKNPTSGSSVETKGTRFRWLRVCAIEDMTSLPIKISKLKLLRYLSLNGVDNLPKSLCKLLNLQYLDLSLSGDLEFPKDFEKLIDLRFLCLSTKSVRLPTKGIGMLKSLRTLIISECEALRSLDEEIGQLSCLRELALESCSKLRFLPVGFRNLERLEISSCLKLQLLSGEDLEGLTSLRQLKLTNLPKLVHLPEGLLDAAGTLTHLEIESCMYFTSPSESVLPELKSLKSLKIWDCENVDSLPKGMRGLTRLQSVSIVGCPLFTTNYEERAAESQKIAHVPEVEVKDRTSSGKPETAYVPEVEVKDRTSSGKPEIAFVPIFEVIDRTSSGKPEIAYVPEVEVKDRTSSGKPEIAYVPEVEIKDRL